MWPDIICVAVIMLKIEESKFPSPSFPLFCPGVHSVLKSIFQNHVILVPNLQCGMDLKIYDYVTSIKKQALLLLG